MGFINISTNLALNNWAQSSRGLKIENIRGTQENFDLTFFKTKHPSSPPTKIQKCSHSIAIHFSFQESFFNPSKTM